MFRPSSLLALAVFLAALFAIFVGAREDGTTTPGLGSRGVQIITPVGLAPLPGSVQDGPGHPQVVTLPVRWAVSGRVVSGATGQPVASALVVLALQDQVAIDTQGGVRTDELGHFSMVCDAEAGLEIFVVAPGFRPLIHQISGPSQHLELSLDPGVSVAGRVTDLEGLGVPGARVWCYSPDHSYGWPHNEFAVRRVAPFASPGSTATTDEGGRFTLGGLGLGQEYLLRAGKAGWSLSGERGRSAPVSFVAADSGAVHVVLRPMFHFTIRTVDAVSHEPIGASLRVAGASKAGLVPKLYSLYDDLLGVDSRVVPGVPSFGYVQGDLELEEGRDVKVSARAFGYEPAHQIVPVQLGSGSVVTIEMMPVAKEWGLVDLRAQFAGGAGFNGTLMVRVGSAGNLTQETVRFASGRGDRSLRLPTGEALLAPLGGGHEGQWWRGPGDIVRLAVPGPGEPAAQADILLRGARVELDVVAFDEYRTAFPQRGYGLGVQLPGSETWWDDYEWDLPGVNDADASQRPSVWLLPGQHRLRVHHPSFFSEDVALVVPCGVPENSFRFGWLSVPGRGVVP